MRTHLAAILILSGAGCSPGFPPPSYVTGLRVLGIKAEPPELAPGQSSTISALAVDTRGRTITISWSQCLAAPVKGQAINPECFSADMSGQDVLQSVGDGLMLNYVMPSVSANSLGLPDASGGRYVPLRADARAGADTVFGSYRVRLAGQGPANHNPTLTGIYVVPAGFDMGISDGGAEPGVMALAAAMPLVVHASDKITLRGQFTADSAESYYAGGQRETEILTIAWFASAGTFTNDVTGTTTNTTLTLDQNLPSSGSAIDLWIVGRDERGGTDYLHRTLRLQ
jgi:hypothetical protein